MNVTVEDVLLATVVAFSALAWIALLVRIVKWAFGLGKAPKARARPVAGPPPDRATARVIDGWLTLVGFSAAPNDRFELEGARPPAGHTGDVVLTIRHRDQPSASWRKVVIIPPWTATSAPIDGVPSLGAEHELALDPEQTVLVGKIVQT